MTWYFCFYINSKTLQSDIDNKQFINLDTMLMSFPSTIVHMDESHFIHMLGDKIKNNGIRTSIILETSDDNEAVMMSLMKNNIIEPVTGKIPVLQFILCDPDFEVLHTYINPLISVKKEQHANRVNELLENAIRRSMIHHNTLVAEYDSIVSHEFKQATNVFNDKCLFELDRIQIERHAISIKAKAIRRAIVKKLISYTTFILIPGLK